MSFIIQYTCPSCGYKTGDFGAKDELIGTFNMESCLICSCNDCHKMFNRGQEPVLNGEDDMDSFLDHAGRKVRLRRHCKFCGSPNINIHPNEAFMPCPVCHHPKMDCECIGTCF